MTLLDVIVSSFPVRNSNERKMRGRSIKRIAFNFNQFINIANSIFPRADDATNVTEKYDERNMQQCVRSLFAIVYFWCFQLLIARQRLGRKWLQFRRVSRFFVQSGAHLFRGRQKKRRLRSGQSRKAKLEEPLMFEKWKTSSSLSRACGIIFE